jgi:NitT/TauT family transport system permease protein
MRVRWSPWRRGCLRRGRAGKGGVGFSPLGLSFVFNNYAGVKNVNQVLVNVVRSFVANEWQLMKVVVLPNSLLYIIAGLRLAIGRAILVSIDTSLQGLTYRIASAGGNLKSTASSWKMWSE